MAEQRLPGKGRKETTPAGEGLYIWATATVQMREREAGGHALPSDWAWFSWKQDHSASSKCEIAARTIKAPGQEILGEERAWGQ